MSSCVDASVFYQKPEGIWKCDDASITINFDGSEGIIETGNNMVDFIFYQSFDYPRVNFSWKNDSESIFFEGHYEKLNDKIVFKNKEGRETYIFHQIEKNDPSAIKLLYKDLFGEWICPEWGIKLSISTEKLSGIKIENGVSRTISFSFDYPIVEFYYLDSEPALFYSGYYEVNGSSINITSSYVGGKNFTLTKTTVKGSLTQWLKQNKAIAPLLISIY